MDIDKKLAQWRAAELIDAETASRIAQFEHSRKQPILLYTLGGLGSLTIGIGVISVVAANWDAIGKLTKLGLDLALAAALAIALYAAARRGQAWLSDVLAGVYYAFVLASIALLGQVYQLGSPTYQALASWSLCTAPFMLIVRGRVLATVWFAGLLTTEGYCVEAWLDALRHHGELFTANVAATVAFASALAWIALARAPWLVRERPVVSATWTSLSWIAILVAGFAAGFLWYDSTGGDRTLTWAIASTGALALVLCLSLPKLYPQASARVRGGLATFVLFSWLVLGTAAGARHEAHEAIGALAQLVLLCIAAWTVLALGRLQTFNVLTALIALRVLVMYFEVFGSMLDTGLGMISGGVLTLLLAWVWKRKSAALARQLGGGAGGHDAA
jgi:uncharacterized membrane protein